jgi:hypothetical protein
MMNPTVLKHGGWLTLALVAVIGVFAFASCRDFETAYETCVDAGACLPDDQFLPDGGLKGHNDGGTDGGTTPGNDAGMDAGTTPENDAGMDAGSDAGPDTGDDAGMDAGDDSGPDAGDDAGMDAGDDAGPDTGDDAGMDAGDDAGSDAGDDAGDDAGMDAGSDAGPIINTPDAAMDIDASVIAQTPMAPECAAGLCLRNKYVLSGPYEFQGLWGSTPDDVFLVARARPGVEVPAQMVRFSNGGFSASTVDLPGFQPFRLQGTDSANVWAINEDPTSGPCWPGDELLSGANTNPLLPCLAPQFRFDGQSWAPAGYGTRTSWSAWTYSPSPENIHFATIVGPDEKNLYAATTSEVLRWTPAEGWQPEISVPVLNEQPPSVQDIWVSADGKDVWVTLKTSYVLRKHDGQWSVIYLPVDPSFSALQVEGFDTPTGDLWITGTWSSGASFGTTAYHFERQEP